MTAYEALTKKYMLEASLEELEARYEELQSYVPELKHQKREADAACLAARGGLQRFLDRLLGKGEEDPETLARAARAAAAALETAQRELAIMEEKRGKARKEQEDIGEKAALMAELTEQERAHFLRLEASICAEAALHFLRKSRKELSAAQELARNPMMAVGDGQKKNTHLANAAELAGRCREKLEKIAECGIDFKFHPYLESPMGYLVTAARYADLDRMNSAMKGIRETETSLKELLLQLAEE